MLLQGGGPDYVIIPFTLSLGWESVVQAPVSQHCCAETKVSFLVLAFDGCKSDRCTLGR